MRTERFVVRRRLAAATAALTAAAVLLPGLAVAATPPGVTADAAPFVGLAHKKVLAATVKADAVVSFVVPGLPAGASAAVLSVSVAKAAATGSLTAFAYGARRPGTVSLSFARGHSAAGTVVAVPGTKGRVSISNRSAATERLAVTVTGYYALPGSVGATAAKTQFVPLSGRLSSLAVKAHTASSFVALGKAHVPTTGAEALVLEVTVAAPVRSGKVLVSPHGSRVGTTLAFSAGRSVTTLVVTKPGTQGRIAVTNEAAGPVRVYADLVGYLRTVLGPQAPLAVTAVAGATSAAVSWTPPSSDGGSPVTAYQVIASPGGATETVAPDHVTAAFTGLTAETPYSFTVMAVNGVGTGPGRTSGLVVPYTVPAAPTSPTATTGGSGVVSVGWSAPADSGGSAVTGYRVTASPGGVTATSSSSPAVVGGLTPGTYYTFAVSATNAAGSSTPSVASGPAVAGGVSRASLSSTSAQLAAESSEAGVSADGRYVAFSSADATVGPHDSNGSSDVFVRDRLTGTTTLVSYDLAGDGTGNSGSDDPSVSDDGRWVAFQSYANNLVSGPATTLGVANIYVRDLQAGVTYLVSQKAGTAANGSSDEPDISADGTTVAFASNSTNLAGVNTTGGRSEVYVANVLDHVIVSASVAVGGLEPNADSFSPTLSSNGSVVAFGSDATNLVASPAAAMGRDEAYVRSFGTGLTTMVSVGSGGTAGDGNVDRPRISANGLFVAFGDNADNLTFNDLNGRFDIFVANLAAANVSMVSFGLNGQGADGGSEAASISADGSLVAFDSDAGNLVPGVNGSASQIFLSDWQNRVMSLVSHTAAGAPGDDGSQAPSVSADGRHVAFETTATQLAPGDTNATFDVYVDDVG